MREAGRGSVAPPASLPAFTRASTPASIPASFDCRLPSAVCRLGALASASAAGNLYSDEGSQTSHHSLMVTAPADILNAARRAAEVLAEHKASDVVMLDLRTVTDMADFFIVASGTSDTHVRSTAGHLIEQLKREGLPVTSVVGLEHVRWVRL